MKAEIPRVPVTDSKGLQHPLHLIYFQSDMWGKTTQNTKPKA